MYPICDFTRSGNPHIGWAGERSAAMDRIMSTRADRPRHLVNRTWLVDGRTVHVVSLKSVSTWQAAADTESVLIDHDDAVELLADCNSPTRHPGPMPWGITIFLEQFETGFAPGVLASAEERAAHKIPDWYRGPAVPQLAP